MIGCIVTEHTRRIVMKTQQLKKLPAIAMGDQKVKHDSAQRARVRDHTRCESPSPHSYKRCQNIKLFITYPRDYESIKIHKHSGRRVPQEKQPVCILILLRTVIPKQKLDITGTSLNR